MSNSRLFAQPVTGEQLKEALYQSLVPLLHDEVLSSFKKVLLSTFKLTEEQLAEIPQEKLEASIKEKVREVIEEHFEITIASAPNTANGFSITINRKLFEGMDAGITMSPQKETILNGIFTFIQNKPEITQLCLGNGVTTSLPENMLDLIANSFSQIGTLKIDVTDVNENSFIYLINALQFNNKIQKLDIQVSSKNQKNQLTLQGLNAILNMLDVNTILKFVSIPKFASHSPKYVQLAKEIQDKMTPKIREEQRKEQQSQIVLGLR